jgi:hypothetical protein
MSPHENLCAPGPDYRTWEGYKVNCRQQPKARIERTLGTIATISPRKQVLENAPGSGISAVPGWSPLRKLHHCRELPSLGAQCELELRRGQRWRTTGECRMRSIGTVPVCQVCARSVPERHTPPPPIPPWGINFPSNLAYYF